REKANPPIDLPQPTLAVLIVGVFTAIAVTGSPRNDLRHRRAFPGKKKAVLIFKALQPTRRYVVLASRRGLVWLWVSRKSCSHLVVLPARIRGYHNATIGRGSSHSQAQSAKQYTKKINRLKPRRAPRYDVARS